jgi:fused signal recognition particle receptor
MYDSCEDPPVVKPEPDELVETRAGAPILRVLVARTWQELFETGDDAPPAAPADGGEGQPGGFFRRLRENMSKTRQAIGAELQTTVFQSLDDEAFERLEETLIYADVGAPTTAKIVERLETEAESGELQGGEQLSRRLRELLADTARVDGDTIPLRAHPTVILVTGVNGSGKTTTVGKMAWHLQRELGRSVLLAAGDTFRAAAAEQLTLWAERAGCEIVRGEPGSDPGAVVYDAIEAARARGHDVVIVDTAGRLHTQQHLMDELGKVRNVIERQAPGAPHETLLTIDATTGQNGLRQALLFREAVDVTGIALTKLDGTAKGGIALAIAQELGVPVKLIGIGEALEDLRPFDPDDFAQAILEP